jgi:hypothetical protein
MKGIRGSMSLILSPTKAGPRRPSMLERVTEKGARIGAPGTINPGYEKEPAQLELPFDTIVEDKTKQETQSDIMADSVFTFSSAL